MAGAPGDVDWLAATNPGTSAQQLAEIAARRPDLHALILSHPRAYDGLRQWIAAVNPVVVQPPYLAAGPAPMPAPRRGGKRWWFAGCGCLVLVVVVVVLAGIFTSLGALAPSGESSSQRPVPQPAETIDAAARVELERFASERAQYEQLAAPLADSAVAPLVLTDQQSVEELDAEAQDRMITVAAASSLATRMTEYRQALETQVTAAQARMTNASGTLTEEIVDKAGGGFIDLQWDAASACRRDDGSHPTACVVSDSPLTLHLVSEYLRGDWEKRMVVTHELAHVYQFADEADHEDGTSAYQALLDQGLFQGSDEKMADCYALTYFNERSLSHGNFTMGYGYVCNDAERQAIRQWADEVNAPMPG